MLKFKSNTNNIAIPQSIGQYKFLKYFNLLENINGIKKDNTINPFVNNNDANAYNGLCELS